MFVWIIRQEKRLNKLVECFHSLTVKMVTCCCTDIIHKCRKITIKGSTKYYVDSIIAFSSNRYTFICLSINCKVNKKQWYCLWDVVYNFDSREGQELSIKFA